MATTQSQDTPKPPVMKVAEVAALFDVSRMTVHRWVSTGELVPLPLPGRNLRFRREDVEAMLLPPTPRSEPETAAAAGYVSISLIGAVAIPLLLLLLLAVLGVGSA